MESNGNPINKKTILALIVVCVILCGSFVIIYTDIIANFTALRDDYQNLSDHIEQLKTILETLRSNQTTGLNAVQIYNLTKNSVVMVTNVLSNGSAIGGSGFVYDVQGHIITNNHVVEGASEITITFSDGTSTTAQLIGRDVYSDLAVIKVETLPEYAHTLLLGNSSSLKVGEPVYSIGNPFHLSGSMTAGIVSQVGRILRLGDLGLPPPWENYLVVDLIQFDAAINPGNSGGPLLNSWSEVVGVTFAIETADGIRGFIGIGYAIPSDLVKRVIPSLIETGYYPHPWIGIEFVDMNPQIAEEMNTSYTSGVLILSVVSGSAAENAGLLINDIIIDVDGRTVKQAEDLLIYLERYKSPGENILLKIVRNNGLLDINLTLGERPI